MNQEKQELKDKLTSLENDDKYQKKSSRVAKKIEALLIKENMGMSFYCDCDCCADNGVNEGTRMILVDYD